MEIRDEIRQEIARRIYERPFDRRDWITNGEEIRQWLPFEESPEGFVRISDLMPSYFGLMEFIQAIQKAVVRRWAMQATGAVAMSDLALANWFEENIVKPGYEVPWGNEIADATIKFIADTLQLAHPDSKLARQSEGYRDALRALTSGWVSYEEAMRQARVLVERNR